MTPSVPAQVPQQAAPRGRRRDPAKSLRAIGSAILGVEAVVVALAIPVVVHTMAHVPAIGAYGLGAIAVLDVVVASLVRRHEAAAVVAGTILVAGAVAAGVLSGILLFLAIVFAMLWGGWLAMRHSYQSGLRRLRAGAGR